jgi:hypothetical protein
VFRCRFVHITTELFNAKGINVRVLIFHVIFLIPIRCHLQAFVDREDAVPVEAGVGLVAIQFEKLRLVKGLRIGKIIPGTIAPVFYQPVGHFGDRQVAAVIGAEVPGTGIFSWFLRKKGTEQQVTAEGFQDMLPGPDGMGTADADGLMTAQGADAIGNEAVRIPVAPADDVARPDRGGADAPVCLRALRKE